ncbi:MAG: aryl-sulfate sulfotransferase [Spirochaetia bacterium]|nr:aryl-sulfate sulfotransferase [Spirochaetia bacterium]
MTMPTFTVEGESLSHEDFLIAPHSGNYKTGWLIVIDYQGNLKYSKKLPGYAYSFKKFQYKDGTVRYAYQQVDGIMAGTNGFYDDTHLVLMNDCFDVIDDHIALLKSNLIPYDNYPCENHDYEVLGDDHFILTAAVPITLTNIPGYEGIEVNIFDNVIQEQKDGKVIWEYSSALNSPELFASTLYFSANSADSIDYSAPPRNGSSHMDYAHINAVTFADDGDFYISFRNIGLIRLDHDTKKVEWLMSRNHNDFTGIEKGDIGLFQHDLRVNDDGSITIFDNSGCGTNNTRICRYWLDEQNRKVTDKKFYISEVKKSPFMGSAMLLDEDSQTFLIAYGGNISDPAFEEYSFRDRKQTMRFVFDKGYDLYQITHETIKVK